MATPPVIEAADCTVSGSNTEQSSWAVSTPAAVAGDLLIVNIAWDDSTTTTSVTAPAGKASETAVSIEGPIASNSTEVRGQSWYYVCTGTWSAGTITFTPSATESWTATVIKVPAGEFDAATPIGANSSQASTGTAETSVLMPDFTTGASDGDGRLVFFALADADPMVTLASGWTSLQTQDLGAVAHGIATRDAPVTDSESITGGTWSIAGDSWASIGYVIRAPIGKLYHVIYPSAASKPSATQVKAGQQQSGSAATASGNEVARETDGEETFASAATGLTGGTSYKTALVWSDGVTTSNVVESSAWVTDTAVALTGSAATSGAGTLGVSSTTTVTGSAATASAGTLTPTTAAALTGSGVTASAGTLTPDVSYSAALTGASVTASAGTLVPVIAQALAGSEVAASAGTLTPVAEYSAALTGTAVTVSAGTLSPEAAATLAGEAATVSAGTLAPVVTAAASGAEVAAAAGTVGVSVEVAASGAEVTTAAGTLTPETEADITVALTGSEVTANAGTLSATAVLGLTGSEVAASAGTIGGYVDLGLTGIAVSCVPGTVVAVEGTFVALTGSAAVAHAGSLTAHIYAGFGRRSAQADHSVRSNAQAAERTNSQRAARMNEQRAIRSNTQSARRSNH